MLLQKNEKTLYPYRHMEDSTTKLRHFIFVGSACGIPYSVLVLNFKSPAADGTIPERIPNNHS